MAVKVNIWLFQSVSQLSKFWEERCSFWIAGLFGLRSMKLEFYINRFAIYFQSEGDKDFEGRMLWSARRKSGNIITTLVKI